MNRAMGFMATAGFAALAVGAQAAPQNFDLRPQALGDALQAFALQSGAQVVYAPQVVATRQSPAVSGSLEPQVALRRLIQGTNLKLHQVDGAFVISAVSASATAPASTSASAEQVAVEPAPQAATAAHEGPVLEEVVVTSRRREEQLQDVPLAVTAMSGEGLARAGVLELKDLVQHTPSLSIRPVQGRKNAAAFVLRGQGVATATLNSDPTVGFYIAEVPVASPYGLNVLGFLDIRSVEIAKGPQGTLFGRNTTGGAIIITPNAPTDATEGSMSLGLGNFSRKKFQIVFNQPINDQLAFRVAAEAVDTKGVIKNLAPGVEDLNGDHYIALRTSLRYRPTDDLTSTFYADYLKSNAPGQAGVSYAVVPPGGVAARYPLGVGGGYQAFIDSHKDRQFVAYNRDPLAASEIWGISNTTELQLSDDLKIKNVVGFRSSHVKDHSDNDGTPFDILDTRARALAVQTSEELQLQYNPDRLQLTAGVFYFHGKGNDGTVNIQQAGLAPTPISTQGLFVNDSISVFAQGTYAVTDRLNLTVGARQTWDKRDFTSRNMNLGSNTCLLVSADIGGVPISPCIRSTSAKFNKPTWNVSADYRLADHQLVYLASRRGYKSGGFTPQATRPSEFRPFQPETVTDVEFGYKGDIRVGEGVLRLNLAAYYSKYKDGIRTQTTCGTAVPGNACPFISTIYVNAAKATIKGLELESTWIPAEGFELSGFYAYTDAGYDRWRQNIAGGGFQDLSGQKFNGVSRSKGGLTARARLPERQYGDIWLQAGGYAQSVSQGVDIAVISGGVDYTRIPAYVTYDARVEWQDAMGSGFNAALWVKNLLDKQYYVGAFATAPFGFAIKYYGDPRTIGVDISHAF